MEQTRSQTAIPSGRHVAARTQVAVSGLAGVAVGVVFWLVSQTEFSPLAGWDAAALVYMVWIWATVWHLDGDETAGLAEHADPTRATADLLLLSASVVSLIAVGSVLVSAAGASGSGRMLRIGVGLLSVVLSWSIVHTVFTLRYARLYYTGPDGGVGFNQRERPRYSDFAYLAFTIGMTFQVSDTDLQSDDIRRTALRHGLLSYLFGTGILATTINLVASLSSK